VGVEEPGDARGLGVAAGDQVDLLPLVAPGPHLVGDRAEGDLAAVAHARRLEIAGGVGVHLDVRGVFGAGHEVESLDLDQGKAGDGRAPIARPGVQPLGRRQETLRGGALRRQPLHLAPRLLQRGVDGAGLVHPHQGVGWQIGGEQVELGVEVGQVELDAGKQQAVGQAVEDLVALDASDLELLQPLRDGAQRLLALAPAGVELAHREDDQLGARAQRALAAGVELAHALDRVTRQLEA